MNFEILIVYVQIFLRHLSEILIYLIFARVLISWFFIGKRINRSGIIGFIYDLTDPVMNFFRKFPHRIGMIDLTPIIALLVIDYGSRFLISLLNLI